MQGAFLSENSRLLRPRNNIMRAVRTEDETHGRRVAGERINNELKLNIKSEGAEDSLQVHHDI